MAPQSVSPRRGGFVTVAVFTGVNNRKTAIIRRDIVHLRLLKTVRVHIPFKLVTQFAGSGGTVCLIFVCDDSFRTLSFASSHGETLLFPQSSSLYLFVSVLNTSPFIDRIYAAVYNRHQLYTRIRQTLQLHWKTDKFRSMAEASDEEFNRE